MKNQVTFNQMNLTELSLAEQKETQGGDSMVQYDDNQGYTWSYFYNDAGALTGVVVSRSMCVQ